MGHGVIVQCREERGARGLEALVDGAAESGIPLILDHVRARGRAAQPYQPGAGVENVNTIMIRSELPDQAGVKVSWTDSIDMFPLMVVLNVAVSR